MKKFKEVKRYICNFCKDEFKSNDGHDCKLNPEKKNCLTCNYKVEWYRAPKKDATGQADLDSPIWVVDCSQGFDRTADYLKSIKYNLNCPSWKKRGE